VAEHAGLLAAICDDTDDDQLRLVYADWLEERGDPRAELIRVEIEYARLPKRDLRREPLRRRDAELLAQHAERWRLPRLAGVTWGPYERGFVESVTLESWQAFVRHVDQIAALVPLRSLAIEGVLLTSGQMAALAGWPRLGRLVSLSLVGIGLGVDQARILVSSPYVANLRRLCLADNELRNAGAETLAVSPYVCGLSSLSVADNQIGASGIAALQSSLYLRDLVELDLAGNDFAGSA
jgi:uncharacterized protein (TIGR02996 family)